MNKFLEHPLVYNLKDHSLQLKEVMRISRGVFNKFNRDKIIGNNKALTEENLEAMEYVLQNCLQKVGTLSLSRNELRNELNDHYTKTYIKSPAIGKKLYLDHFYSLHKPYDRVKDSIWNSIHIIIEYKENNF